MTITSYLYDLQQGMLDQAALWLSQDRTGVEPPERVYVSFGTPPADAACGQLAITFDSDFPSITHNETRQRCAFIPRGRFAFFLYRCVPVVDDDGSPPLADEISQSSADITAQLWAFLHGLYASVIDGSLYAGVECDTFSVDEVQVLPPLGGVAGFKVAFSIPLNDGGPT